MNKILSKELDEIIEGITLSYEDTKKKVLKSMFMKYLLNAKNNTEQELILKIIKNISWHWDVIIDEYISNTIVDLFDERSIIINHLGYNFKKKEICTEKASSSPNKIYASLAKDGCVSDQAIVKLVEFKDYKNIEKIFLVDDFIGSGSQILNVLNFLEEKGICDKTIYIITYACYELGEFNINKFNEKSKNNVILEYKIMENNYLKKLLDEDLIRYINSICERCSSSDFKFGYLDCGCMVSMNGSSPNNNVSLLWSDDIANWNKLLDRDINITILANKKNNYIRENKGIILKFFYKNEISKFIDYDTFYLLVLIYNCYGMDIEALKKFKYFATIEMCEEKVCTLQEKGILAKGIFLEIIDEKILELLGDLDKIINRSITNSLKVKNTKFY